MVTDHADADQLRPGHECSPLPFAKRALAILLAPLEHQSLSRIERRSFRTALKGSWRPDAAAQSDGTATLQTATQ
jgi:hypothetical protein